MTSVMQAPFIEAVAREIPATAGYDMTDPDNQPLIALYTVDIPLTPNMLAADFTPPTYTGYATQNFPTLTNPMLVFRDPATNDWVLSTNQLYNFKPSADTALPQTIVGYFITNIGGLVIWASKLDVPFTFNTQDDVLQITPLFRLRAQGLS